MSAQASDVDLEDARSPLVVAVDVGSTATRAGMFDSLGRQVGKRVKVGHAFRVDDDGTSEIDPDQVVHEVATAIDGLAKHADGAPIAGVGLDTFASSLIGVGRNGRPLTPCFTYADSRCAPYLSTLREQVDEDELQQRTGTRLHTSYQPVRLRWLAERHDAAFSGIARWLSIGEYIQWRLVGAAMASTPTAAWSGLLDRHTGAWDEPILRVCGVDPDRLAPLQDPGRPLDGIDPTGTGRWPWLADASWFPAVADGLSSNMGTGAVDASSIGLAAATSGAMRVLVPGVPTDLPRGLWCYRVDAKRSLLGGAVNDVGRLVAWLHQNLRLPEDDDELDVVLAADPDPRAVSVVPFLTGERSTGWAANARAVVTGIGPTTTAGGLFRSFTEGIAHSYARVAEQLRSEAPEATRIVASGRITQALPHLLQILADALQTPVEHVAIKRATLRGTALLILETLAPEVTPPNPPQAATYAPREEFAEHYAGVARRFEQLYGLAASQ